MGDGRVRAFEPTIEPYEFVVAKPARALNLGFGRASGCRLEGNTEAARRGVPIIVVRFHAPAEGRVDEIGRASGRESVCQAGSISVVAGSLKKKEIKNIENN